MARAVQARMVYGPKRSWSWCCCIARGLEETSELNVVPMYTVYMSVKQHNESILWKFNIHVFFLKLSLSLSVNLDNLTICFYFIFEQLKVERNINHYHCKLFWHIDYFKLIKNVKWARTMLNLWLFNYTSFEIVHCGLTVLY